MAEYVAKIPDMLQAVKIGDVDAMLKLILIYSAVGDDLMAEKMRVVALYNYSYSIPFPLSFDKYLIEKANVRPLIPDDKFKRLKSTADTLAAEKDILEILGLNGRITFARLLPILTFPSTLSENKYVGTMTLFLENCSRTKFLLDSVIFNVDRKGYISSSNNILADASSYVWRNSIDKLDKYDYVEKFYRPVFKLWGEVFHDEDVLRKAIDMDVFSIDKIKQITSQFEYKIVETIYLAEKEKKYKDRYLKRKANELIAKCTYLMENAKINDPDAQFTPWLRQLKNEGYFWTRDVAANSWLINEKNEKRKAEEKVENRKQTIRNRGKRAGIRTFEVKGVPFNMVLVKPNPKAKYSDWNSGVTDYAPKASYYIAETEVTQELWDAVMGISSEGDVSQHPKYTDDTNKWPEFQNFINKLNKLTGKRFRIPTHAEWEYAAHEGDLEGTPYCINYSESAFRYTPYDVAKGTPNELGLYDILSGVSEFNKRSWGPAPDGGSANYFGLRLALSAQ